MKSNKTCLFNGRKPWTSVQQRVDPNIFQIQTYVKYLKEKKKKRKAGANLVYKS